MIKYDDSQQTISTAQIKVIGLGGAGRNIIDRVILDGLKGPEVLAISADIRTLDSSSAKEKIQLGKHVTRGLGCGGDPELGKQAAYESEDEIRASIKGRKIVFICVGLGGGTGSGAAPTITRIAREEQAFTVVFATMPFSFEGTRRRIQAETALNELAALADTLVTFDNGRMAELVLAKKGIHEAFSAADSLITDSINSISRIVLHPGIIHIGLDDLVTTLSSNRSRCLFGCGKAKGNDRVTKALSQSLNSPLLDKGKLLKTADTILIHVCGGPTLTMFEADHMMKELNKSLNPSAQIFFGVSVDEAMGDEYSVTIISSLPEEEVVIEEIATQKSKTVAVETTTESFVEFPQEESEVLKKKTEKLNSVTHEVTAEKATLNEEFINTEADVPDVAPVEHSASFVPTPPVFPETHEVATEIEVVEEVVGAQELINEFMGIPEEQESSAEIVEGEIISEVAETEFVPEPAEPHQIEAEFIPEPVEPHHQIETEFIPEPVEPHQIETEFIPEPVEPHQVEEVISEPVGELNHVQRIPYEDFEEPVAEVVEEVSADHFTSFVEAEEISEIPTDETIVATVLTPIEETHEYLQDETVSVIKPAEETTSRRRFAHLFAKKNSTDTEVENTEPAHVEEPKKKTGRKSSFSKILERANIDGDSEEPANQNIVEQTTCLGSDDETL